MCDVVCFINLLVEYKSDDNHMKINGKKTKEMVISFKKKYPHLLHH